jgi:hypothetical protein
VLCEETADTRFDCVSEVSDRAQRDVTD